MNTTDPDPDPRPVPSTRHRDDLQGLRAVAVLLVVLAHAGVPALKGGYVGVDVFFVLSGFLITGLLLSRAARDGRVSLADFYVRRARRILPAAALTLVATTIAAYHLLTVVRAKEAVTDSIWAALFAANVRFAAQGGDYFAQDAPPSPVQHFWSLAVEEQFYLVWPALVSALLFGTVGVLRLRRGRARGTSEAALRRLLAVTLVLGGASLAWSVYSTHAAPEAAYYSTFARAWELALGAALALGAVSLGRLPAALRAPLGWAGVAAIGAAAVLFSGETAFPGWAALLPALGAALVIAAGVPERGTRLDVGRALSLAPCRYVGDRSYALYLWHWPVLVIAAQYAGRELTLVENLLLAGGAFVLSIVSYATFENPIRHMTWRRPAGAALWPASAGAVLAFALFTLGAIDGKLTRLEEAAAAVRPATLVDPAVAPQATERQARALPAVADAVAAAERGAPLPSPLTPSPGNLLGDFYFFPNGCTPGKGKTSSKLCRLGDPRGLKTIVVFGDSHAQMWMPPILRMAQADGWLVVPLVKIGCIPRAWVTQAGCRAWYRWAKRQAAALRPDVVLVAGSWGGSAKPAPDVRAVNALAVELRRAAATVIVIGDAPHQRKTPAECLLAAGATMRTCTTKALPVSLRADDQVAASARKHRVGFIGTRGWFCARGAAAGAGYLCPMVINRTITWVDRGHISRTYGLQLTESFRAAFRRELFR